MNKETKEKIYRAMDSFLVESEDIKGNPITRSVERLNEDRHLFVNEIKKIIEEEREEIQRDINSVIGMLNGSTDREEIKNYIVEYLKD